MKKTLLILFVILLCLSVLGCKSTKEDIKPTTTTQITTSKSPKKVDFPIDIQLNFYPPTYFCRIEENGTVLLKKYDGWGIVDKNSPKGFDKIVKINEDSSKEKISAEVRNRIKELVTELTKVETYHWAVDCTNAFIYFKDEPMIISVIESEKSYKFIEEIIDLLNEHTSLDIDEKYY